MADEQTYIGIDLGGTNVQCAVVGAKSGKILARDGTKTKAEKGAESVVERVVKLADDVLEKAGLKRGDVAGVGIGAPGAIDADGVVLNAVNLGWNDFPLGKHLEKQFELPVLVDNDVNVGAWGEYKAGAGRDAKALLAVFVGTGIGGGLVLDGELWHGPNLTAGEIGHTVLHADAPIGRRTLEDRGSRTNIVRSIIRLIESNHPSAVSEIVDGDFSKVRSKVLSQAWSMGDNVTTEVIGYAAKYVGTAIANTVTLLSLDCVVLGGGLTEAIGKPWVKLVKQAYQDVVFPAKLKDVKLIAAELEDDSGPVGAALLAKHRLEK